MLVSWCLAWTSEFLSRNLRDLGPRYAFGYASVALGPGMKLQMKDLYLQLSASHSSAFSSPSHAAMKNSLEALQTQKAEMQCKQSRGPSLGVHYCCSSTVGFGFVFLQALRFCPWALTKQSNKLKQKFIRIIQNHLKPQCVCVCVCSRMCAGQAFVKPYGLIQIYTCGTACFRVCSDKFDWQRNPTQQYAPLRSTYTSSALTSPRKFWAKSPPTRDLLQCADWLLPTHPSCNAHKQCPEQFRGKRRNCAIYQWLVEFRFLNYLKFMMFVKCVIH